MKHRFLLRGKKGRRVDIQVLWDGNGRRVILKAVVMPTERTDNLSPEQDIDAFSSTESSCIPSESNESCTKYTDISSVQCDGELNIGRLTAQDLADLEDIQAELDSLTSDLPNSRQSCHSVPSIPLKQEVVNLALPSLHKETSASFSSISDHHRNVAIDSFDNATLPKMVSDNASLVNSMVTAVSTSVVPCCTNTIVATSSTTLCSVPFGASAISKLSSNSVAKNTKQPLLLVQNPVIATTSTTTTITTTTTTVEPTSMTSVVVQSKSMSPVIPVTTATNVTVVQPVIDPTGATKVVTIPAVGLVPAGSGLASPASLNTLKSSDMKALAPQPGVQSPTLLSVPQIAGSSNNTQSAVKRSVTPSGSGQVITKVIITNNPVTNQPAVTPLAIPVTATSPIALTSNASSIGTQQQQSAILLASPSKSFTVSKAVMNTTGQQQIIKSVPGTPPKQQGVFVLSPVKPSSKVPPVPVSVSKSPRRIAPASNHPPSLLASSKVAVTSSTAASSPIISTAVTKTTAMHHSPTKVIFKPVSQTILKPPQNIPTSSQPSPPAVTSVVGTSIATSLQQATTSVSAASVQQIQVPGSKFHYVRLVSAPGGQNPASTGTKQATLVPISSTRPLAPAALSTSAQANSTACIPAVSSATQVRLTVPIAPAISTHNQTSAKPPLQRVLIPTSSLTSVAQIQPNPSVPAAPLGPLTAGTLIPAGGNMQSFVMVPAQYITQLQQSNHTTGGSIPAPRMVIQPVQPQNILPAPVTGSNPAPVQQSNFLPLTSTSQNFTSAASAAPGHSPLSHSRHVNGRTSVESGESRPRKPCNCTKSQCLKLYCDCFANGEFCNNCNCGNCFNNLDHEEERQKAIKACLDRNPLAFHPKIGKGKDGDQERRHTKGCNCKRSGCLKNYCECYEAKILCTSLCKCVGCKNFEDSSERKTLMHLADAAEVRVQQQAAAKTKISSQIQDLPTRPPMVSITGERLPFAFITQDVVEATCLCLLAQAEDGEKSGLPLSVVERLVLDEFGRCLMQIIECANKTKVSSLEA